MQGASQNPQPPTALAEHSPGALRGSLCVPCPGGLQWGHVPCSSSEGGQPWVPVRRCRRGQEAATWGAQLTRPVTCHLSSEDCDLSLLHTGTHGPVVHLGAVRLSADALRTQLREDVQAPLCGEATVVA